MEKQSEGSSRIWVEEIEVKSANKTMQGERKWKQSTITIDGVRRSDDKLCIKIELKKKYEKSKQQSQSTT